MGNMARSQNEIVARVYALVDDVFGFRREVLLLALDYENVQPFLRNDVGEAEWPGPCDVEADARDYLNFAIDKIRYHRGISASRSVDKLGEYAWLLCRDDVVAAMDAADYPQYGAPKVRAFADGMGWLWPDDSALARMARGERCVPFCGQGCGE